MACNAHASHAAKASGTRLAGLAAPKVPAAPQQEADKSKRARDRVEWSAAEVQALIDGVRSLGKGAWLKILAEKRGAFQPKRTAESLKVRVPMSLLPVA